MLLVSSEDSCSLLNLLTSLSRLLVVVGLVSTAVANAPKSLSVMATLLLTALSVFSAVLNSFVSLKPSRVFTVTASKFTSLLICAISVCVGVATLVADVLVSTIVLFRVLVTMISGRIEVLTSPATRTLTDVVVGSTLAVVAACSLSGNLVVATMTSLLLSSLSSRMLLI